MTDLFRLSGTFVRDPRIESWFSNFADPHRHLVHCWFEYMRECGPDIRETMHDGCPVACVGDVAFAYVNAFKAHANVGFFRGAMLADSAGLLEGTGKRMRHVKLRPGVPVNEAALKSLIDDACSDIRQRIETD